MRLSKILPVVKRSIQIEYRTRLWDIIKRFKKSVTINTNQGVFTIPLEVKDPISWSLYTDRQFEMDLISEAMECIRKFKGIPRGKGTLIDIGANNGIISIGMLVTGELEKAVAIEPDPRNFSNLRLNVAQNHLETAISCLNYAVSDSESTLQFELSETNYGDHRVRKSSLLTKELYEESKRRVINVESNTLDNLLIDVDFNDISVIWIDVQGYEGYVFKGAKKVLSTGVPVVSEIWPYAIKRSGMSRDDFCCIIGDIWSAYWVKRRGRFIKYPIDIFYTFFDELGSDVYQDNVIFTKET